MFMMFLGYSLLGFRFSMKNIKEFIRLSNIFNHIMERKVGIGEQILTALHGLNKRVPNFLNIIF